jgi:hypothetical protein
MCIEAHEIISRGIPEVTQVKGLKQKVRYLFLAELIDMSRQNFSRQFSFH